MRCLCLENQFVLIVNYSDLNDATDNMIPISLYNLGKVCCEDIEFVIFMYCQSLCLNFDKINYDVKAVLSSFILWPLTLNRRSDVLNVTQKRLSYAELTFKTSPKR